ncbi:MAG: AsmA family protein, partial [Bosea sp.]|uniref:AsmA family protein n=1 Tax=Bosea sp. (in: a-proteobacteria) TaxID=1871050 RepID=UPI0023A4CD12|nr:AsmA family protein [Bosea sp. (in: a-proteobacteria)]
GPEGAAQAARWPFTIRAKIADAAIEATGASNAPFDISGLEADLDLNGENLQSLQRLIPFDGYAEGPFRLAFQLTRDGGGYGLRNIAGALDAPAPLGRVAVTAGEASVSADNALSANLEGGWRQIPAKLKLDLTGADRPTPGAPRELEVTATLGDTALSGRLQLAPGEERPKISGDLSFAKFDLTGIAPDEEASRKPGLPQGGSQKVTGKTWSEHPLPLAVLRTFDADLTLKADLVTAERIQAKDVRSHVLLDDGRLRLEAFSASLPGLPLTGRATLDTAAKPPAIDLALAVERVQLAPAFSFLSPSPKTGGTLRAVALKAKAQGDTPAALIKTLDD